MENKVSSFLNQAFIFALVMLVSNGISYLSPIPLPASVVGLILLFLALCTGIVKLEQVEALGTRLTSIMSFLFVPSGISLINSMDLMKSYGIQIIFVIIAATLILMAAIGWSGELLKFLKEKISTTSVSHSISRVHDSVKEVK